MGITNLLQFLKPITTSGHVEECRGQIVGVDAMCWMHRGAAACAIELVEGKESDKFLRFFISMVSLLRFYGVTPLVVFDGNRIDVKSGEDEKRRLRRETAKREALELLEKKRKNISVDYKELMSKCSQSISITPAMVDKVIAACRELGIRCIVAPFEADAQLAFLSRTNQIHSAISEDSDLLAYGCKRVMLKMDKDGKCDIIRLPFLQDENEQPELSRLEPKTTKQNELLRSLKELNHERFVAMCVLCGCDYTNRVHINGMGIATAFRLVSQLRSLRRVLDFLCRDKKWSSRFPVDKEEVVAGHLEAEKTFTHHKVFDPKTQRVVFICSRDTQMECPGLDTSLKDTNERAIEIASGLIDPRTGLKRKTELSPAERELIRECQEKAFSGLEAQQLKVQAAAFKEEALRKQAEELALKESASRQVAGEETAKREAAKSEKSGANAGTVVRIAARSGVDTPRETQRETSVPAACSQAAISDFDAFALPTATANSKQTDIPAESFKEAKKLLQEMRPQGFQGPKFGFVVNATQKQKAPAASPEDACYVDGSDVPVDDAAAAIAEGDKLARSQEKDKLSSSQDTRFTGAACNLSQFAFKWAKAGEGSQPVTMKTGWRDLVTRTHFAHRTKLLSAPKKPPSHPFPVLTATARSLRSADVFSVALPKTDERENAGLLVQGSPAKRKSVGFIKADETEGSSAFLSVRFAQEEPKRHKLL